MADIVSGLLPGSAVVGPAVDDEMFQCRKFMEVSLLNVIEEMFIPEQFYTAATPVSFHTLLNVLQASKPLHIRVKLCNFYKM